MKRFVIVGAAGFSARHYAPMPGDFLLAADGGLAHLERAGLTPQEVLGDFDSLGYVPDRGLVYPIEKDDTDSMLAVRRGLSLGYRDFLLLGCLDGERLDHTIANLQTLLFLEKNGAHGYLVGEKYCITALSGGDALRFSDGCQGIVSVFCMGAPASGVTLTGLQYTITDAPLTADFPLGVSNHFTGAQSTVSVKDGTLLVMWDRANGFPRREDRRCMA